MREYSCYVFDLDGTIYRGDEVLPGAGETVRVLRSKGAKIFFATNNSGQTEGQYVTKLRRLGVGASEEEILTSGRATARYCAATGVRRVFVVGEPGLVSVLESEGIGVVNFNGVQVHPVEAKVEAVVCGICRDGLTYALIDSAMQNLLECGKFIGTNADASYPLANNKLSPGAGAVIAAIQTATGIRPTVIGKPNPYMLIQAFQTHGIIASEAVVIGDRIDTDMMLARAAGSVPILVTTGVDKKAPDGITSIGNLIELIS